MKFPETFLTFHIKTERLLFKNILGQGCFETWKRWSNDREFSRDPSRQCANNIPLLTSACAVVAKCKKSDIDPFAMSWLYNSCMCACFHWRLVQWGIVCVVLLKYTMKAVTKNLWLSVLYKGQFNAHLWNWTCWTLQKGSSRKRNFSSFRKVKGVYWFDSISFNLI